MSDGGQLPRILDVRLELQADPESDPQDQELAVRRLQRELAEFDSAVVRPVAGPSTPPGSKATDPVTIGAVVLALSASGGVFVGIVETVKDWLGRQADRHRITLTVDGDSIELTRASAEERQTLIEAFVGRHSAD